jgi:tripartite-type tricarboxylate transporter receptor subunit TctC
MKTHRIFVAGIIAVCLHADAALAQDWPTRPVTMVVPFGAGGSSDVIGRVIAEGLRVQLGQPVIVENISGAGGMIGASRVAKAAPDGYQFVIGNVGTHAQNQWVYKTPQSEGLHRLRKGEPRQIAIRLLRNGRVKSSCLHAVQCGGQP